MTRAAAIRFLIVAGVLFLLWAAPYIGIGAGWLFDWLMTGPSKNV